MAHISGRYPVAGESGARLYFTDFNVSHHMAEITAFGESYTRHISARPEISFSGIMTGTEGSYAIMKMLLNSGGIDFMQERREWRCVWCASPNPIDHRHCSQCGGPRGWIL